jgi:transcriptional regulator with XRE-family HTH domain
MCHRLRQARIQAGLTQAQAATALGQPQNFVSKCETGERRIDPVELADFIALYGVRFDALVPPAPPGSATSPRRVAEPAVKPRTRKSR